MEEEEAGGGRRKKTKRSEERRRKRRRRREAKKKRRSPRDGERAREEEREAERACFWRCVSPPLSQVPRPGSARSPRQLSPGGAGNWVELYGAAPPPPLAEEQLPMRHKAVGTHPCPPPRSSGSSSSPAAPIRATVEGSICTVIKAVASCCSISVTC